MSQKKKPVNISISVDVLAEFDRIIGLNGLNRSWILQECMKAYAELYDRCQKAGVKRLPTLEFKGCEKETEAGDCPPALKKLSGYEVLTTGQQRKLKVAESNPSMAENRKGVSCGK